MTRLTKYLILLASLCGLYLLPYLFLGDFKTEWHILVYIKAPVCLTAILVGACICSGSAALQTTLNNPLADPGIIGISSGASLIAAIFLVFISSVGINFSATEETRATVSHLQAYTLYYLPLLCFIGASLSGFCIYILSKKTGGSVSNVILAGIAISTLFSAIIGWIYLIAPPQALQTLTFWLMGSLNYTNYKSLMLVVPIASIALYLLYTSASSLNLLYLGEHAAASVGINSKHLQNRVFILVALLIGLSVSVAGGIAFLGLLVPHFVRRVHGFDNQHIIPYSAVLGSIVMMLCALINEYFADTAIPLSMLTATIGAPLFIYVLLTRNRA